MRRQFFELAEHPFDQIAAWVDRAIFRNAIQRFNKRVRRIPFLEHGEDGTFEGEFSNITRSYTGKGVVRYAW
jgi:hypothetical protein